MAFLRRSEAEEGGFLQRSEAEGDSFLRHSEAEGGGFLRCSEAEGGGFLLPSEAEGECWVHYSQPETKRTSIEWRHCSLPKPQKFCKTLSTRNFMLTLFCHCKGPILNIICSVESLTTAKHTVICLRTA